MRHGFEVFTDDTDFTDSEMHASHTRPHPERSSAAVRRSARNEDEGSGGVTSGIDLSSSRHWQWSGIRVRARISTFPVIPRGPSTPFRPPHNPPGTSLRMTACRRAFFLRKIGENLRNLWTHFHSAQHATSRTMTDQPDDRPARIGFTREWLLESCRRCIGLRNRTFGSAWLR
jgi:hypothetical protein